MEGVDYPPPHIIDQRFSKRGPRNRKIPQDYFRFCIVTYEEKNTALFTFNIIKVFFWNIYITQRKLCSAKRNVTPFVLGFFLILVYCLYCMQNLTFYNHFLH